MKELADTMHGYGYSFGIHDSTGIITAGPKPLTRILQRKSLTELLRSMLTGQADLRPICVPLRLPIM